MGPTDIPSEEEKAAIDAVFEEWPIPVSAKEPAQPAPQVAPEGRGLPEASLGDYTRELQQEFSDQEEEGKL